LIWAGDFRRAAEAATPAGQYQLGGVCRIIRRLDDDRF